MNAKLDCAVDGAMDMQAKTQCLGLFYQMGFAAHFLELRQPELQSTSESTNSFHEESICLQWLLDLGCASDLITTHFYVNNFRKQKMQNSSTNLKCTTSRTRFSSGTVLKSTFV